MTACTEQFEVSAVRPSRDFSGLSKSDFGERRVWAAFDVFIAPNVARSIRRWQLENVTLKVFRCDKPIDAYPAPAMLRGKLLHYRICRSLFPHRHG